MNPEMDPMDPYGPWKKQRAGVFWGIGLGSRRFDYGKVDRSSKARAALS